MIVADVNLLVYVFVPGPHTAAAAQALVRDPVWVVPPEYKYELLNVMATHVRKRLFTVEHALQVVDQIERTVTVLADPDREQVLRAAVNSGVGTYDCEYAVLARTHGIRVVTADRGMLAAFADVAVSIDDFAAGK